MTKGDALCTLTSEIAIFRRNSQHCRGSDVSGAGSVVFCRQLWGPWRGRPRTATLSRIPAPTPPDPERQGHLYFEAAPLARGSVMIFFRYRYLRHFCGATSEFSQHCRESGVSLRKSDVFYRAAGDPGSPTSPHYRKSGIFCRKSDAFYRVAGDPWGPIRGKGTGLDTNAHLAGQDYRFPRTTFRRSRPGWPICPGGQSAQMANPAT